MESEQIVIDCLLEADYNRKKMNKPSYLRRAIHPAFTLRVYITSKAHTEAGKMEAEWGVDSRSICWVGCMSWRAREGGPGACEAEGALAARQRDSDTVMQALVLSLCPPRLLFRIAIGMRLLPAPRAFDDRVQVWIARLPAKFGANTF